MTERSTRQAGCADRTSHALQLSPGMAWGWSGLGRLDGPINVSPRGGVTMALSVAEPAGCLAPLPASKASEASLRMSMRAALGLSIR